MAACNEASGRNPFLEKEILEEIPEEIPEEILEEILEEEILEEILEEEILEEEIPEILEKDNRILDEVGARGLGQRRWRRKPQLRRLGTS